MPKMGLNTHLLHNLLFSAVHQTLFFLQSVSCVTKFQEVQSSQSSLLNHRVIY